MESQISIATPLWQCLNKGMMVGAVVGVYERAYNLVVKNGRFSKSQLITLTQPNLGNGPFSIVIPIQSWPNLKNAQPVHLTLEKITAPNYQLPITNVTVWNPTLSISQSARQLVSQLRPFTHWPHLEDKSSPMAQRLIQRAQVYQAGQGSVESLIGLGNGLTPAGDDYLLGCMAALRLNGRPLPALPPDLAERTTAVSTAYLQAAAQGHFAEPWHLLVAGMMEEETAVVAKAIEWLTQLGATSGYDALTGFAQTIETIR